MTTTGRLLHLLDLLQSRPVWSGTELAAELGVTTRSVRRDVERLRELGYPVNAERGAGGGYRLGAGRGMPPLLLTDDEAVAVAVSLRLAAAGTITGASEPALRTLAKLDQVMPPRLRHEVRAIRDATSLLGEPTGQVDGDVLLTLARACRDRVRVRFGYRTSSGGASSRTVEPIRLVATGRRWYLMAWAVERDDWRTFRLDRMTGVAATTWGFRPREHPDPVEFVHRGLAQRAWHHQVTVRYHCTAEEVARFFPSTTVTIEPAGEHCLVHTGGDDLGQLAAYLGLVPHDFEVLDSTALSEQLLRLAQRFTEAARGATT